MLTNRSRRRSGFSLLELVIVVVILGIIAAIAIPRMSRGSRGAADAALHGDLATLRSAIELYKAEHDGDIPPLANIEAALTQYSNKLGTEFQATQDATHLYGPYIRKVPPLPVGNKKGSKTIAGADGSGVGWIYTAADGGSIKANTTTEEDDGGTPYNTY